MLAFRIRVVRCGRGDVADPRGRAGPINRVAVGPCFEDREIHEWLTLTSRLEFDFETFFFFLTRGCYLFEVGADGVGG